MMHVTNDPTKMRPGDIYQYEAGVLIGRKTKSGHREIPRAYMALAAAVLIASAVMIAVVTGWLR